MLVRYALWCLIRVPDLKSTSQKSSFPLTEVGAAAACTQQAAGLSPLLGDLPRLPLRLRPFGVGDLGFSGLSPVAGVAGMLGFPSSL